jgi:hypothetical protein
MIHSAFHSSYTFQLRLCWFLFNLLGVLPIELLNAPGGVKQLLPTRIERVTIRTNFDVQIADG